MFFSLLILSQNTTQKCGVFNASLQKSKAKINLYFKLNISNTCEFVVKKKKPFCIFFIVFTQDYFWKDLEFYVNRKMECMMGV